MIDPNNPTGAVYLPAVRQALVELADRHNIVLLADEVYNELVYAGPVPPIAALMIVRWGWRSVFDPTSAGSE